MKAPNCPLRRSPHSERDRRGQLVRRHDAGQHGVLPVVAHVGDAVGPAHHLAFGRGRRGPRPAVVGDAVDRLRAQVERRQRDVGAPGRVVESLGHVGAERVLAGVAARTVAAVVAECDGLGQVDVEAAGPRDGRGDLRHLEGVGQTRALVVLGEHEDLRLAGQAAEGGGVQDAVAVALEAGAPGIGLFGLRPLAGARRSGGARGEQRGLELLALGSTAGRTGRRRWDVARRHDAGAGVGVGQADGSRVALHRRCPTHAALGLARSGHPTHVMQSARSL